jgi:hypothetical protein
MTSTPNYATNSSIQFLNHQGQNEICKLYNPLDYFINSNQQLLYIENLSAAMRPIGRRPPKNTLLRRVQRRFRLWIGLDLTEEQRNAKRRAKDGPRALTRRKRSLTPPLKSRRRILVLEEKPVIHDQLAVCSFHQSIVLKFISSPFAVCFLHLLTNRVETDDLSGTSLWLRLAHYPSISKIGSCSVFTPG